MSHPAEDAHPPSRLALPLPFSLSHFPFPVFFPPSHLRLDPPRIKIRHLRRSTHGEVRAALFEKARYTFVGVLVATGPVDAFRVVEVGALWIRVAEAVPEQGFRERDGRRGRVVGDLARDFVRAR